MLKRLLALSVASSLNLKTSNNQQKTENRKQAKMSLAHDKTQRLFPVAQSKVAKTVFLGPRQKGRVGAIGSSNRQEAFRATQLGATIAMPLNNKDMATKSLNPLSRHDFQHASFTGLDEQRTDDRNFFHEKMVYNHENNFSKSFSSYRPDEHNMRPKSM